MKNRAGRVVLAVVAFCLAFPLAAPAFATTASPVPNHAIVGGTDLYGMSETEARAAISREASVTNLPNLRVQAAGRIFTVPARTFLRLNVDAMVAKAYAPSAETTFTIPRNATVDSTKVYWFVRGVAAKVRKDRRSAFYYVSRGKLKWRRALYGRALQQSASRNLVTWALMRESASGARQPQVNLPCSTLKPKVTDKKLGRAILIDQSKRTLRLYDHSKVIRKYRVAIGTSSHPTPLGKFKVVAKSKHPAWRNPGSAWAANMPAYIAPGPSNPLGLRALYINSPGIRIHGTNKYSSIGTRASHGCIRVANSNIVKLYPKVPVGTPVFIIR